MRRPGGDGGNAVVEFTGLAVLLMVPLVYLLLGVFEVQRAAFGVTEAARQAGRAYATADDVASGQARAAAAAALAMRDQGLTCGGCLSSVTGSLEPGARVTVTVRHVVHLPLVGALLGGDRAGVPVDAVHVEHVDRFKEAG